MKPKQIQLPSGNRVVFVRSPRRLSPELLHQALGSMPDDDPRWIAFHQILDEEIASAMLDVTAEVNPSRDHAAGVVAGLTQLKQRLVDTRNSAPKSAAAAKPRSSARS